MNLRRNTRPKNDSCGSKALESRVETLEECALRRYVPSCGHTLVVEPAAVGFIRLRITVLVILPCMKQCGVYESSGIRPFVGNVALVVKVQGVRVGRARN